MVENGIVVAKLDVIGADGLALVFFAENLVASPLHTLFRRRFVKWGTEWRYVSLEEMHEFLLPFEITSILILVAIMGAVVLASKPPSSPAEAPTQKVKD